MINHTRIAFGVVALCATLAAQNPAQDIRSSDVDTRLSAIDKLVTDGSAAAAKALVGALRDKDWEVQERAAAALGKLGAKTAVKGLCNLAIKGDVRRVRATAADAIAAIDGAAGSAILIKKVTNKKTSVVACEALSRIWAKSGAGEIAKLDKLLKHKQVSIRRTAAVAWLAGSEDRVAALTKLLFDTDKIVQAAALDLVTFAPRTSDVAVIQNILAGPKLKDTTERRAIAAVAAAVLAHDGEGARKTAANELCAALKARPARLARVVTLLHAGGAFDDAAAIEQIKNAMRSNEVDGRAAAAKALGDVGGKQAAILAQGAFENEFEERVRYQLLDTFARNSDMKDAAVAKWMIDNPVVDREARVRTRAVVRIGGREVPGAVSALAAALQDPSWQVVVSAAVSLGKTYDDAAVKPILELSQHRDWKRRGAAAVAMMHLNRKTVIDRLIDLVADDVPMVARAAHHGLAAIFDRHGTKLDKQQWRDWWSGEGKRFLFRDWKALDDNRKKYGYDVPDRDIYENLDVLVFLSREGGDHIEHLLDKLEIPYRTMKAKEIGDAGPHPEGICVINCAAEIDGTDVEPLRWFVHTGGALFGSCWALQKTIERVYPGVVRKYDTPGRQVLGDVLACACQPDSSYLRRVFPPHVRPIYRLEGAHLIDVLDPERFEVLIDSPQAAEDHGCGNLAGWFQVGHGVIFDSANHFDLQGLKVAAGLKTANDRQVYAVDHMGLTFKEWRDIRRKAYWKKTDKAADAVPDKSAFRFLTNFVRSKRIGGL